MVSWAEKSSEEEKWNSVTHSFGFGLFLAFILCDLTLLERVYSFGASLTLFLSTAYHSTENPRKKSLFRMLDMASIHLLISTTSVCYIYNLGGNIWHCVPSVLVGLACTSFSVLSYGKDFSENIAVPLYVLAGTLCLVSVLSVKADSGGSLFYFALGTVVYLLGLLFYLRDYKKWYHTMWHLFVLAAAMIHLAGLGTI